MCTGTSGTLRGSPWSRWWCGGTDPLNGKWLFLYSWSFGTQDGSWDPIRELSGFWSGSGNSRKHGFQEISEGTDTQGEVWGGDASSRALQHTASQHR